MKKLVLLIALFAFIGSTVTTTATVKFDDSKVVVVKADKVKDLDKDKDKKKKDKKKGTKDCKSDCSKSKSECSKAEKKACCPGHTTKECTKTKSEAKQDVKPENE
ncbi:MAG: hypothetical protein K9H64_11700 [Bacteroidales bacterium]|nr:hypothetical protein [Bacteroidales bacterium]MCF8456672.1 hypothetical protein [Bacteroidales bacterium]